MGDDLDQRFFSADDYAAFRERLDAETDLLGEVIHSGTLSQRANTAGFELEAWLVDAAGDPAPCNDAFLEQLDHALVVPELAAFNIEVNGTPTPLSDRAFTRMHEELADTWRDCCAQAEMLDAKLVAIGILPTVRQTDLCADRMSSLTRYRSLNDRLLALRDGRPLEIDIDGETPLRTTHGDVMLEAGATSFQIHLQCHPDRAVRDFNASLVASAPLVAVAANSPWLFEHALWDETRIPLFEQALDLGEGHDARVTFGSDYVHASLFELFDENRRAFRMMMPAQQDAPPAEFPHVCFQNGTVWRWNRPLIGFDADGQTHLRIENRVVPAGPTLRDAIANSAFYFGLVRGFGLDDTPIETTLPFAAARDNFYRCARHGLNANVLWPHGSTSRERPVRGLIVDELVPLARRGLQSLDLPDSEIDAFLDIIAARADTGRNGAAWQRGWIARHGRDFNALVLAYHELQQRDEPVHGWSL